MTKNNVAFCGYRCDLCPAHAKNVGRLTDRTTLRAGWRKFFGFDVPEERLICVGCDDEGNHLDTDCPVRPCVREKHIPNCSFCDRFDSCDALRSRADVINQAKEKFAGQISQEQYEMFFRPYEGRAELRKQRKTR